MKFIADAMLGRLARWLRALGFDVLYHRGISDGQLLKISREQERTILTRDTLFLKRKGVDGIFIRHDDVFEQLAQLRDTLDFREAASVGRCMICNGLLDPAPCREEVRESVPDFVYLTSREFARCRDCGRVYWEGSHQRKMREKIETVFPGRRGPLFAREEDTGK
ncbi:MAG: Mut7-C RNAse domain-containing protein [Nitrospiraceae bacterium]|nr:Mut7-C RNAse domain-containing protein [Nitrospiraceae bacterium]